ncbi:glutamine amidotransferase-related protein [Corynebacterium ulceribovis]|uniref:glutamine amidotransferase-related protein n=1 Tax=Corynebacterium ulceribovis TaxID=487732 RepID=UPI000476B850|nr:hypothetical protein [Corynebacterium ulceribovis]
MQGSAPITEHKPFLLLTTRPEGDIAYEEYLSFLRASQLPAVALHHLRLDLELPEQPDIHKYSGIIVGGSPYNFSDPDKSQTQLQIEGWLLELVGRCLEADFPFLGACYGVGLLGYVGRGVTSRKYGEPAGGIYLTKTPDGAQDPILNGLPERFGGHVGHLEACEVLPKEATLLVTGENCRVQMYRYGTCAYATQFHPELDLDGFHRRVVAYGGTYHEPGDELELVAVARERNSDQAQRVLQNFVEIYRTPVA